MFGFSRVENGLCTPVLTFNDEKSNAFESCKGVFKEYMDIGPVSSAAEGARVSLETTRQQTDAYRLLGATSSDASEGTLLHKGWVANQVRLPQLRSRTETKVITPAEVEV